VKYSYESREQRNKETGKNQETSRRRLVRVTGGGGTVRRRNGGDDGPVRLLEKETKHLCRGSKNPTQQKTEAEGFKSGLRVLAA
jgi:hypothetical protein